MGFMNIIPFVLAAHRHAAGVMEASDAPIGEVVELAGKNGASSVRKAGVMSPDRPSAVK
jgi:hypothetical protein